MSARLQHPDTIERVLVTGGAGFIGSHIVDDLLGRGLSVATLDNLCADPDGQRTRRHKLDNIAGQRGNPRFALLEGDIRDATRTRALVADFGPDLVIHLAARPGVRPSVEDPAAYYDVNVGGTVSVLEACRAAGVRRVVLGSSSSVYGRSERLPFVEDDPLERPASPYAASKIACEAMCRVYAELHDFSVVCLRYFSVYGPRMRPDLVIRVFAERMLRGQPIDVYGAGDSRRDYTYVGDIVAGTYAAATARRGAPGFERFNLGSGSTVRLTALIEALERALGCAAALRNMPEQPGDVPATWASIERARERLGYAPRTNLEDGLRSFAAWLRGRVAA